MGGRVGSSSNVESSSEDLAHGKTQLRQQGGAQLVVLAVEPGLLIASLAEREHLDSARAGVYKPILFYPVLSVEPFGRSSQAVVDTKNQTRYNFNDSTIAESLERSMTKLMTLNPAASRDICDVHYVNERSVKAVQKTMIGDEIADALAETFKMLSDPTRVKILFALSKAELCVCDLSALLGMNESAVSHHLRLLKALKLVKYRREGRMAYYSLDDEHIERLFRQGLEHVQESYG